MSNAIMVIGESGTGKTTSLETLDPTKTFIINVAKKPLPFKGWMKNYKELGKDGKGNYLATDNSAKIIEALKFIDDKRSDIEYVIIDDMQYTMANEYMRRINETGFKKFSEIGQKLFMLVDTAKNLRDNLNVAFLTHSESNTDASGTVKYKAKTIGKLVDNVVTLEGLFTVVLYTELENATDGVKYWFLTQNSGSNTGKSPRGMFKDKKINNDLKFVFDKIDEYNIG